MNPPTATFCSRCGAPLTPSAGTPAPAASPPAPVRAAAPPPPATVAPTSAAPPPRPSGGPDPGFAPNSSPATATGVLLLAIAAATGWIPLIGIVGGILGLAGLVYMFNGRRDLGPVHHRNVVRGLALFLVAVIGSFVVEAAVAWIEYLAFARTIEGGSSVSNATLAGDILTVTVLSAVFTVIGGLSRVLMVHALATPRVRRVLWIAVAASVGVVVVGTASVLAIVVPSGNPLATYATWQYLAIGLSAVPSILFAWAYYAIRGPLIGRRSNGPGVARAPRFDF